MKNEKTTLGDRIQVIGLIINIGVVIGLAIWNYFQEERLSKLEYDELAPRIVIFRDVHLDLTIDYAFYHWIIRNNGRTAAENIIITVFSNAEFPFETCTLGVPFDNVQKRVSGDYIIFEGLTLSPQGTIAVDCPTKSGVVMSFMEKHKVVPDVVPSLNCEQSHAYSFDLVYLLPNIGITANNVEPSRISCVENVLDVYK